MKDISVEELAKIVGTPEDKILSQMKEAGLNQASASDLVTDQDKKVLLDFLKGQQSKTSNNLTEKKKAFRKSSEADNNSYKEKKG